MALNDRYFLLLAFTPFTIPQKQISHTILSLHFWLLPLQVSSLQFFFHAEAHEKTLKRALIILPKFFVKFFSKSQSLFHQLFFSWLKKPSACSFFLLLRSLNLYWKLRELFEWTRRSSLTLINTFNQTNCSPFSVYLLAPAKLRTHLQYMF